MIKLIKTFVFNFVVNYNVYIDFPLQVPLTDVVDPPDYEEFVLQNSCTVERDPFRDLILYPEDDVDVHSMPRKCRTVKPIVPELG